MLISLGKKPRAVFVPDAEALAAAAADFVRRMKSEEKLELQDIVILTVSTLEKSVLAGATSLAGIPLAHQLAEGKVWFTTVRRYKGLEAKAVLLVDVHVSKLVKPTYQRLVYVGSSCASAYLETIFLSDVSERSIRRWSSSWIPISNRLHKEWRSGWGWRRNNFRNSRIVRFEHDKSRLLQIVF